jgi:oligopeptide transport system substrate-binding protein
MNSKKLFMLLGLLVIASLVLSACQPAAPAEEAAEAAEAGAAEAGGEEEAAPAEEEMMMEEGPVTYYSWDLSDLPDLDPQRSEDVTSINAIENLFVHLTNYDLDTAEIVPETATSWEVSDDGLVYTFHLRTDIPWVYHNPVTGETTQVTDDDGNPRFVTAQDFVNGAHRACDPDLGSYYSSVIAPQLQGCSEVLFADDPAALTEDDYAAIGVVALDDATVQYTLAFPASYFLSMTPMWTLAAIPQWTVDQYGESWIEAGNIVTNGRFVLHEWVHGVRRTLWRNPLMPADMAGDGNVEVLQTDVVPDTSTGYALWLAGEVDRSAIPSAELQAHLDNYPDETVQVPDLAVFYISFLYDKEPFDDPLVREAFSAAFDRETYVTEVYQGQGIPMRHFAPPGIAHAPAIDEVGLGYDPERAVEALAEAGYPNCEGFPQVTLLGYSGELTLRWIEFAQANWSEVLGCDPDLIQIEQQSFADLLATTSTATPIEDRPHMWTLGWGPDYADENNWVGDVLWCENPGNRQGRVCNETDDKIVAARQETDPAVRDQLYSEIEGEFFGEGGEFPFAPLYLRIAFVASHSWLHRTEALFGGQQAYTWTIDTALRAEMTQ